MSKIGIEGSINVLELICMADEFLICRLATVRNWIREWANEFCLALFLESAFKNDLETVLKILYIPKQGGPFSQPDYAYL